MTYVNLKRVVEQLGHVSVTKLVLHLCINANLLLEGWQYHCVGRGSS